MEIPPLSKESNEGNSLCLKIRQKLEALAREHSISIDMRLSLQERESIERVSIERDLDQFDFYGSDEGELKNKLESYFAEMGQNETEDLSNISNIIARLSKGMQGGLGGEEVWTMVRVSLPNDDYAIPRWHPDGKYYASNIKQYKLVATIKGAQTRFGEVVDDGEVSKLQRQEIENYNKNTDNPEFLAIEDVRIRRVLSENIKETNIAKEGSAVIYLVGEKDAVFHSEPDIIRPRIFVAVLTGSREEIAQWKSVQTADANTA